MNKKEAIEELLFQSSRHRDVDNIRWEKGFVEQLRYSNLDILLLEENFHMIVFSIYILRNEFEKEKITKEILSCLFSIIFKLDDYKEKELLKWKKHINAILFMLLDGCGEDVAFELYEKEFNSNLNKKKKHI